MKVLITGVNGFIGSHILEKIQTTHDVLGTSIEATGKSTEYVTCDISDSQAIHEMIKNHSDIETIIHCAAIAHNKGDDLSRDRFMQVNYQAVADLVDASNQYLKLKQFIFLSTISVYGEKHDVATYSETSMLTPSSPYAVAKKQAEEYIQANCQAPYFMLRLSPVYSPTFRLNIERRTVLKGKNYVVGNGKNRLSLLNVNNITHTMAEILAGKVPANTMYNLADQQAYTFQDMLAINQVPGITIRIPKLAIQSLYQLNKLTVKKQFIDENTTKLLTDNIYSTKKIQQYIELPYTLKDLEG
ncbi:MAG: NAD-dependent epimerase/dehydratase family protein [Culicoidibacterales bacterium]